MDAVAEALDPRRLAALARGGLQGLGETVVHVVACLAVRDVRTAPPRPAQHPSGRGRR
ncbi:MULTISPECIES: hypothetical protein [unclassified Streptomyces]|uniref:hypothetical protein n=1 Tax=unclassified Streptomyces TaxID=2593676 RepID=UPI0035E053DD